MQTNKNLSDKIDYNENVQKIDNAVMKLIIQSNKARIENKTIDSSFSEKFFKSVKEYLK